MSENHLDCSTIERRDNGPTSATLYVHIGAASRIRVDAIAAENRVVLDIGDESRATLHLFINAHDLDRLHAVLDEASTDLGRPIPSAAQAAPDAYASGWDAAIAFCQTSTDEPIPAAAKGGPYV